MIRILSSLSVCTTTSNLRRYELPIVTNRFSVSECAGSGIVSESASPNTVDASSKVMPPACCASSSLALLLVGRPRHLVLIDDEFVHYDHGWRPLHFDITRIPSSQMPFSMRPTLAPRRRSGT